MKRLFYVLIILFSFLPVLVFAIDFPVSELGNCASKQECKAYCDLPENMEACLDFAETHKLMPGQDIEKGRKMLEIGETAGPGGCIGQAECKAYCDDISHIKECVAFAEEHNMIPPEELEEAKKVIAAIDQGLTPPPCGGKAECDIYCSDPSHMEECMEFSLAAGLIPEDEIEEVKKVLELIKKGVNPPDCHGKEACDIYCSQPENIEECVDFAVAAGFMTEEEALMVKKTGGKGPGGCHGKEECEAYCNDPANMEECIKFAIKYGFMSEEEAENALKMLEAGLTGGPGGCKGQEECDAYCNDLSHMEECIDFAVQAGFMTQEEGEDAKKMAEMGMIGGPGGCQGKEECDAFCNNPDNMQECIEFGEKMGMISPEDKEMMMQGGPGGCMGKEECEAYCNNPDHSEECIKFGVEQGFITPEEAEEMLKGPQGPPPEGEMSPDEMMPAPGEEFYGPGGCKTKEECNKYCSEPEHFKECGMPPEEEIKPTEEYIPPQEEMSPDEMMPAPGEEFYGPGGCKTKEECNKYCSEPEHFKECGMSPEEEIVTTPPIEEKPTEETPEFPSEEVAPPASEETIGETTPSKERFVSFAREIKFRSIKSEPFTNVFLELVRKALRK